MTTGAGGRRGTISDLIRALLDRGYEQAARASLNAIAANSTGGVIAQRLRELEAEAARLAAAGLPLRADNPVLRALLVDLDEVQRANRALVDSAAVRAQFNGVGTAGQIVRQTALPGLTDQQLGLIGVTWNSPDPEAVARLVNFVQSDAWAAKLALYQSSVTEQIRQMAIRMIAEGIGPSAMAKMIAEAVEGLPAHYANQMMRTLYLTSSREAQRLHRVANADILEYQLRIATLDNRTCMACWAQHGEILPLEARIDDHHNGRCISVTKVRGRAAPNVVPGPDQFDALPEDIQRAYMGPAKYEAYQAGAITFKDFPREYQDDVFGRMIGEASLKGILGGAAKEYYSNGK